MQTLRTKSLIYLFWLPIAISVFLDAGGGYKNVSSFTELGLILFLFCGVVLMVGCFLHIFKPSGFSSWFETKTNYKAYFSYLLFAGIFGVCNIFTATNELLLR